MLLVQMIEAALSSMITFLVFVLALGFLMRPAVFNPFDAQFLGLSIFLLVAFFMLYAQWFRNWDRPHTHND